MALKPQVNFAIQVMGDGSDRIVVVDTAVGPFGLGAPGAFALAPSFSLGSLAPTGIGNVTSDNGHNISASIVAGVATFTYAAGEAPANGEVDVIHGQFTFAG